MRDAADLLETVAALLRAFPSSLAVHCEAHARGLPEEDSAPRRAAAAFFSAELLKGLVFQGQAVNGTKYSYPHNIRVATRSYCAV